MPFQRFHQLISRQLANKATKEGLAELEALLAQPKEIQSEYDTLISQCTNWFKH